MRHLRNEADRCEEMTFHAGVLLGLVIFLWMATDALAWLGPYFDEWIFVPVSLHFLGECEVDAAIGRQIGCIPWMQMPPYVGVIKALLLAPVFGLWGVSEWTVRLPPIFLSVLMFWRLGAFLRPRLGLWTVAVLLLVTTDVVFVEQARFDWGPVVIATLCKLLGLAALWRWLEQGRRRDLVLLLVACIVGLLDKLSFVWVVLAYSVALMMVWPDRMLVRLRSMRRGDWWVLGGAAVVLAFIALQLILPAMAMKLPGHGLERGWLERAEHVLTLFDLTFSGVAVRRLVFDDPAVGSSIPRYLLFGQLAIGFAVLYWRRRHLASDTGALRLLAFCSVVIGVLFALLVYTPEVGGAHHLIVLWPYNWLHVGALLVALDAGISGRLPVLVALRGVAICALLALGVQRWQQWSDASVWWRGEKGSAPLFDPAIGEAANAINSMTSDVDVISGQWGLHQALVSMAAAERRSRYHDWMWALASDSPDVARHLGSKLELLEEAVVVSWIPPLGPTPSSTWRERVIAPVTRCVKGVREIDSSRGQPLIRIERLGFTSGVCEN